MIDPAELLPVALEAAERATTRIRQQDPGTITAKGDRDMASEVDYAVEDDLRTFLAKETPEIDFLGEEHGGADAQTATAWILDPVDGTANYLHGLPMYAVSLALVEAGRPILGAVYLPALNQRYWAAEGGGAYRDGNRITVSSTTRLEDAIVSIGDYAVGEGAEAKNRERFAVTEALAPRVQRIRMLGSAAIDLCWVAEGRLDACVLLSNHPWDVSAGAIIAREASARISDQQGNIHSFRSDSIAAATPGVAARLSNLIRDAVAQTR
ncbi:inositol monophosphatase family protein [Actinocatenispora comari]|uniref:Inositol monophosphatase n=1 Tax=Actinocatenispora comari TaxID=2807577 RepID=A0A8J4A9J3_9ACTN|nr:inositol monophosphatase family protein [Actinocatenispora comari]GIL27271.1 inositol monophosphatase [Actinocatenispora comari]